MTSPARALAILALFTEQQPTWQADDINRSLSYSRATGYRYVKDLVEAGLLQKVSAGQYALGARIIELDSSLRRSDPVLLASAHAMKMLARRTRLDTVLTAMFGEKVVDTHHLPGDQTDGFDYGYGRGRPRSMFHGAASKVLLARQPRRVQVRIHSRHARTIAASGMGDSLAAFLEVLSVIRREGFFLSRGEVNEQVWGAAVPLMGPDGDVLAALALAGSPQRMQAYGLPKLRLVLAQAATEVAERLVASQSPVPVSLPADT